MEKRAANTPPITEANAIESYNFKGVLKILMVVKVKISRM